MGLSQSTVNGNNVGARLFHLMGTEGGESWPETREADKGEIGTAGWTGRT